MHRFAAELGTSLPEHPARGKLNFDETSGKTGFSGGTKPFSTAGAAASESGEVPNRGTVLQLMHRE